MPTRTVFACPAAKPATTASVPLDVRRIAPAMRHRERPDDRDAGEIGDPVAPGLHRRELRPGERAEDEARHGEREDEVGQALAGAFGDEPAVAAPRSRAPIRPKTGRTIASEAASCRASAAARRRWAGGVGGACGLLHRDSSILLALALELGQHAALEFAAARQRIPSDRRSAVDHDFVVEVRAGREAGRAEIADHLALAHPPPATMPLAKLDCANRWSRSRWRAGSRCACHSLIPSGLDHRAVAGGQDRRADAVGPVDAGMHLRVAEHRMAARCRSPSAARHRRSACASGTSSASGRPRRNTRSLPSSGPEAIDMPGLAADRSARIEDLGLSRRRLRPRRRRPRNCRRRRRAAGNRHRRRRCARDPRRSGAASRCFSAVS